jgi:hypothetical protein
LLLLGLLDLDLYELFYFAVADTMYAQVSSVIVGLAFGGSKKRDESTVYYFLAERAKDDRGSTTAAATVSSSFV